MPARFEFITVVFSVALAITTTALKAFKFQENWLNYRTVAETLRANKHCNNAGAIECATAKKQLFVKRVEALI